MVNCKKSSYDQIRRFRDRDSEESWHGKMSAKKATFIDFLIFFAFPGRTPEIKLLDLSSVHRHKLDVKFSFPLIPVSISETA
jgi:hypothetical protein